MCAAQVQSSAGASFRQEGIASWYGTEFDGRPTASGEIFNSALFTAAHPTLPFGTVLTVTNRHNNRKVAVRVNDRGPFVSARIIDLSRAAAEQLDMLVTGTAPVVIEGGAVFVQSSSPVYVAETSSQATSEGGWSTSSSQIITSPPPSSSPDPIVIQQYQQQIQQSQPVQQVQTTQQQTQQPVQQAQQFQPVQQQPQQAIQQVQQPVQPLQQAQPVQPVQQILPAVQTVSPVAVPVEVKPVTAPAQNKVYRIQVGSYRIARNAVETFDKLKNAGLNPVYERNGELFRVVLSGIRSEDVESVTTRIAAAGFRDPLLREER
ncbi:hypothetical protein AGMMS49546_18540 [Spirochaetia bacterium]|nr:hypothetical protein AGMMS49546_18540 [Spirochaetia bacterium]